MQHRCRHMGQLKFMPERCLGGGGVVSAGVGQDANGRGDGELALVQCSHGMLPQLISACFSSQYSIS